jgi:hypothetical protein
MTWAAQRRLQYLGGLFGVFLVVLFIFLYPIIFKKPTCQDNKKNGTETGIDCGGSCSLMCKESTSDPVVLWSRAFPILDNTYNFVAYIENQNKNSGIRNINYEFRAYDVNNRLLGRRQGSTYIPPNKQFTVFEPHFNSGESKIKSVTFEFIPPYIWEKKEPTLENLPIFINNIEMGSDINSPSLSAQIKNESVQNLPSFEATAILYDIDGNAISVSRTLKDGISSGSSVPVYFTWPEKLSGDPVKKEILIEINPFTVSF